jgi:hypothetical protein
MTVLGKGMPIYGNTQMRGNLFVRFENGPQTLDGQNFEAQAGAEIPVFELVAFSETHKTDDRAYEKLQEVAIGESDSIVLFEKVLDLYLDCLENFRKKGEWKKDYNTYTMLYTSVVKLSDEWSDSENLFEIYMRKI